MILPAPHRYLGRMMRVRIEIDDELMRQAMAVSGHSTKKATIEAALRLLVEARGQKRIREAFGKLPWDDDLETMRLGQATRYPAGD